MANNNNPQQEEMNAGCIGIGFSVLFPIVGIILYFAERKSVSNPSAYLYGAGISFLLGFLLRACAGVY